MSKINVLRKKCCIEMFSMINSAFSPKTANDFSNKATQFCAALFEIAVIQ